MQKYRWVLLFMLVMALCAIPNLIHAQQSLHILYTQNNNGELDNCNCPSNPLGGFEKRMSFFTSWMAENPNTLILDSGDFLSFDGAPEADLLVLELMGMMGYSALNVGDQEFSNGDLFFDDYLLAQGLPLVSSNLLAGKNGIQGIQRYLMLNVAGLHIAITGVLSQHNLDYYLDPGDNPLYRVADPNRALKIIHDTQEDVKQADLQITLSNLGLDRELDLGKTHDFLDIIIGGHSQHLLEEPQKSGNAVIVQSGKNGYHIGHLSLVIEDQKIKEYSHELIPMGVDVDDDPEIVSRIGEL